MSRVESSPLRNKKKRKAFDVDSGKGVESVSKGNEREKMIAPSFIDSTLVLFPLEVSVFNEPSNFLKKSGDLHFPADEKFLNRKKMEEAYETGLVSTFQVNL